MADDTTLSHLLGWKPGPWAAQYTKNNLGQYLQSSLTRTY